MTVEAASSNVYLPLQRRDPERSPSAFRRAHSSFESGRNRANTKHPPNRHGLALTQLIHHSLTHSLTHSPTETAHSTRQYTVNLRGPSLLS